MQLRSETKLRFLNNYKIHTEKLQIIINETHTDAQV